MGGLVRSAASVSTARLKKVPVFCAARRQDGQRRRRSDEGEGRGRRGRRRRRQRRSCSGGAASGRRSFDGSGRVCRGARGRRRRDRRELVVRRVWPPSGRREVYCAIIAKWRQKGNKRENLRGEESKQYALHSPATQPCSRCRAATTPDSVHLQRATALGIGMVMIAGNSARCLSPSCPGVDIRV